ncbi:copper homeostasis protein CutC [Escherichia coli]
MPRMEKIMAAAGPLAVTFIAPSICALTLYIHSIILRENRHCRVLTSGQKSDALQGLSKIMELIAHRDAPIIMAGADPCRKPAPLPRCRSAGSP